MKNRRYKRYAAGIIWVMMCFSSVDANDNPDKGVFVQIDGVVRMVGGGIIPENSAIKISAYVDETAVTGPVLVNTEGSFLLRIPERFRESIINLVVDAGGFHVTDESQDSLDLSKGQSSSIIQLVTLTLSKPVYVAGFVIDGKGGSGVPDSNVVVTHKQKKILSLRTDMNGWYESVLPLAGNMVGKKITFTVLKRGYKFKQQEIMLKKIGHIANIKLDAMADYSTNFIEGALPPTTNFFYGVVVDKKKNIPIPGAFISLYDANNSDLISGGVSRDSRFFSLPYSYIHKGQNVKYRLNHYDYDYGYGNVVLNRQNEPTEFDVSVTKYKFSFLMAASIYFPREYHKDDLDESTGNLQMGVGLAWFPDAMSNRGHSWGYDMALNATWYTSDTANDNGEFDQFTKAAFSVGVVTPGANRGSQIYRFGLTYDKITKTSIYVGFGALFLRFGKL